MIPETFQKIAGMCFLYAEESLSILERAISLETQEFSQDVLLSSISFARRSEALAALEHLTSAGIFSHTEGLYTSLFTQEKLKTIYLLVKGMDLAPQNSSQLSADIVMTLPKMPNRLQDAIRKSGPETGLIQKTDEIFDHLAHQAIKSFVVMTPFLDNAGAKFLMRLFSNVRIDVEKKLILRFLSPQHSYNKYTSGYPTIRDNLKAMGVKVYSYAIQRESTAMLETFHAKVILTDSKEAYIGSSNFDQYSLENSMELGILITGDPVRLVKSIIKGVLAISNLIE